MKFKKETLRKIIQEELQAVLSEQNSSTAFDANLINNYPQERKKVQQKGLALIDKLASLGALNQDQGNRFRREINNSQTSGVYLLSLIKDLESEVNKYELSDETPSDIASQKQLDKIARSKMRTARLKKNFNPKVQVNQQIYNMVLKRINSKLPPLKVDGQLGSKTRAAGREIRNYIRKNLPRGTTTIAGIEQILGAGMETLKKVANRKILDNNPEAKSALATVDTALAKFGDQNVMATPKGPQSPLKEEKDPDKECFNESFKRFL